MEFIYAKNHKQTMVCLIHLIYQKFDSIQESCSGKTFCQQKSLHYSLFSLFQIK